MACVMSGNTYSPYVDAVKGRAYKKASAGHPEVTKIDPKDAVPASCATPKVKTPAVRVLDTTDAILDAKLTYKDFISGMALCPQVTGADTDLCIVDPFDVTTFTAGKATGKKGDKPYSWAYKWNMKAPAWGSCSYTATFPKAGFKGGLMMTHVLDVDTSATLQIVNSGVGYLYNSFTMGKLSVGKTDKIIIPVADSVDITMTATTAQTTASTFSLTFERQTNEQLALYTLEHGGVIVWVIIGIVVFCLLCVGVIVWKKCFHKTDDFYLEDCYARV